MAKNKHTSPARTHSLPVRILAIVLTVLVTGGAVTYLGWFLINLFS